MSPMRLGPVGLLPLMAACAPPPGPRLQALPLEVESVDLLGLRVALPFEVQNPHPQGYALTGFDGEVSAAGRSWRALGGEAGLQQLVSEDNRIVLPLTATWDELYAVALPTRGTDTLPFLAAGAFSFDGPEGALELPFELSGGLPAVRPPTLRPATLSAQPVVGGGWILEIGLSADNDMAAPWELGVARVQLAVDGLPVGEAELDLSAALPGPGATALTVAFPVDPVADGPALQGSLAAESVVLRIAGDVEAQGAGVSGRAPVEAEAEVEVLRGTPDTGAPGADTGASP